MRQLNLSTPPGIAVLLVRVEDDAKRMVPAVCVFTDRWVVQFDNGDPSSGGLNMAFWAPGYTPAPFTCRMTMPPDNTQNEGGVAIALTPSPLPFRAAPDRAAVLQGQITMQGLTVDSLTFGPMPWWPACWAWLTQADRAHIAPQLLSTGDTVMLIQLPDGIPLYDEAAPNFYTADKFPALDLTHGNTGIDAAFIDLIAETLGYGFAAVWIFLGGDDGENGYPIAVKQSQFLGPALAAAPQGNLNAYVLQSPGWDGVFFGYTPQHLADWATTAKAAGALYVGVEHQPGRIPAGGGEADYRPGGLMSQYDLVLGEFDGAAHDDTAWQILGRMIRPYNRPPDQPAADDPDPPFYLAGSSCVYRVFEYYMYGFVRGTLPAVVAASKAQFVAMGAVHVC